MERHRWNATEEFRDRRPQGDKVEENGRPLAGDVRTSLPGSESQWRAQENEEHR